MEVVTLPYGKLRSRGDARPINKAALKSLTSSIKQMGILNPLRVRATQIHEGLRMVDGFEIVAGNHRYRAAIDAEVFEMPCVIITDDDLHAELVMIDENLCRAELGPAETAENVARRKEIYEILFPDTVRGGNQQGPNRQFGATAQNSFTTETAERSGRSERNVQRDAERGKKLGADLKRISGTSLDKGVELDALVKMNPEDRENVVARAQNGERVSARRVVEIPEQEDREQIEAKKKRKLMAAWNDCPPAVQQWFIDTVEVGLIMDENYGQ